MDTSHNTHLERIYNIWGLILIVWALYRVYVHLPEWLDELIFKPLIFLFPVILYVSKKELRPLSSLGFTTGKLFRDIYLGIGFGMLFAVEGVVANAIKYSKFSFTPVVPIGGVNLLIAVGLAIVSACIEEVLVRGFFYTRLKEQYKSEIKAMFISTAMYLLILVPAIFTVSRLTGISLVIFIMTNLIISFANTMIFNETKTLTVPILIHAFWNMAVALYL